VLGGGLVDLLVSAVVAAAAAAAMRALGKEVGMK
jgi:hypothetical protein